MSNIELDDNFAQLLKLQLACLCDTFKKLQWYQQPFNNFITVKLGADLLPKHSVKYTDLDNTVENTSYYVTTPSIPIEKICIDDIKQIHENDFSYIGKSLALHKFLYSKAHINCIIHLNTSECAAVSGLKSGIKNISQASAMLGPICYYGDSFELEEMESKLNLGTSHVIVLINNGILCVGDSIHEAFHYAVYCQEACKVQINCLAMLNDMHEVPKNSFLNKGNPFFEEFEYYFSRYLKKLLSQGELLQYATTVYSNFKTSPDEESEESLADTQSDRIPKSESNKEVTNFTEYKVAFQKLEALSLIRNLERQRSSIKSLRKITRHDLSNSLTSGVLKAIVKRNAKTLINNKHYS